MQPEEARLVRLPGVPTTLYMRLHAHIDDVLRELALLSVSDDYGLGPGWEQAWEKAYAAERAGCEHVDVELLVPLDTADRLQAAFEQADALERAGLLLTTGSPPDVRELRDVLVSELTRRLRDRAEP